MRQSSMRSQRSKGYKAKNVLQMFVLAAICIWLLYQLKHSYDKKRIIEERNAKITDRVVENHADIFKLGRKDLPNVGEMGTALETHHKEDENEEAEEEEHETKHETEFDERNGLLDDQFDEEPGHGEESSEEKDALIDETDSVDEEEHEGDIQEAREEHYKRDDASSAVHHDPQITESEFRNEGARSLDEEKMTNETVIDSKLSDTETKTEAVDSKLTDTETKTEAVDSKLTDTETKTEAVEGVNGTSVDSSQPLNNSTTVEHHNQRELQDNNFTGSIESNTLAVLNNQSEIQSNYSGVETLISSVPMQNETVKMDSVQDRNSTSNMEAVVVKLVEKSNTSEGVDAGQGGLVDSVQTEKSNTNEVGGAAQGLVDSIQIEKLNTSEGGDTGQGLVGSIQIEKTNISKGGDVVQGGLVDSIQMEKSNTSENNIAAEGQSSDPLQTEKPNPSEKVDVAQEESGNEGQSSDPLQTEKPNPSEKVDVAHEESGNPSHRTITAEEKEARVDLSTLPDNEIKGSNTDYEASE